MALPGRGGVREGVLGCGGTGILCQGGGSPGARGTVPGGLSDPPFPPVTQRQKDNLTLPSAEHQAIESSQAGVETWKYKAKNSLMYYPEGEQAGLAGSMAWGL